MQHGIVSTSRLPNLAFNYVEMFLIKNGRYMYVNSLWQSILETLDLIEVNTKYHPHAGERPWHLQQKGLEWDVETMQRSCWSEWTGLAKVDHRCESGEGGFNSLPSCCPSEGDPIPRAQRCLANTKRLSPKFQGAIRQAQ